MVLFGLLNYEDYILRTIVTSTYARNALTVLLMYLITGIIRFHLSVLLCWLCTVDNFINLLIPVVINVLLALLSDTLYQYVGTHRSSYEILVDYIITNYSRRNMIRWKRFILVGVFIYILIVLALINIDNTFLLISTLQTAAGFIICDLLEHRQSIYHRIERFRNQPKVNKLLEDFAIIHDYKITPVVSPEPIKIPRENIILDGNNVDTLSQEIEMDFPGLLQVLPTSQEEINSQGKPELSKIICDKPITPPRSFVSAELTKSAPVLPRLIYNNKQMSSPVLPREIDHGRISPPIPTKPPTPPTLSRRIHRVELNE